MRRPVIGITISYQLPGNYRTPMSYSAAVEKAGGLPLLLPYRSGPALIPQLVDLLDGVIFTGGDDLDPSIYGETYHPKTEPVDPDRQRFELALLAEVERRRMPALGICMGCQLMNIHRGGSLHQFLPELDRSAPLEHRRFGEPETRHDVAIDRNTMLGEALAKDTINANSSHKQSVKQLGRGLRITAHSPDGVVEAIEDPTFPLFVGVQWHPERLAANEEDHLKLFRWLVEKAKNRPAVWVRQGEGRGE